MKDKPELRAGSAFSLKAIALLQRKYGKAEANRRLRSLVRRLDEIMREQAPKGSPDMGSQRSLEKKSTSE